MKDSNDNGHVMRRVKIIVFLPLTIFLFMTGWILYCIGDQRTSSTTAQKEARNIFEKRVCEEKLEASPQQIVA